MAVPPPPPPDLDKQALRKALRHRRQAFFDSLELQDRARFANDAAARLASDIDAATSVAAFVPFASELDPLPALAIAAARGKRTALPHVTSVKEPMRFLAWTPGDPLIEGMYGLLQPREDAEEVAPDLIVMPLVGFDRSLNRIGNGAGFYDRTVARLVGAKRVGFAWSVQEAERVPTDPWDQPLDAVVTELARLTPDAFAA
jgi:5-formyltetrahydrofolate cyclo-ligase